MIRPMNKTKTTAPTTTTTPETKTDTITVKSSPTKKTSAPTLTSAELQTLRNYAAAVRKADRLKPEVKKVLTKRRLSQHEEKGRWAFRITLSSCRRRIWPDSVEKAKIAALANDQVEETTYDSLRFKDLTN